MTLRGGPGSTETVHGPLKEKNIERRLKDSGPARHRTLRSVPSLGQWLVAPDSPPGRQDPRATADPLHAEALSSRNFTYVTMGLEFLS